MPHCSIDLATASVPPFILNFHGLNTVHPTCQHKCNPIC